MASNDVIIGGVVIDAGDPCAVAAALEKIRLTIVTGGAVEVTRFGDDEVRFTRASVDRLDALILDYRNRCALVGNPNRKRRFAKRFTYL